MSNTLNEQLAVISLDFFPRLGWNFTLPVLHMLGYEGGLIQPPTPAGFLFVVF